MATSIPKIVGTPTGAISDLAQSCTAPTGTSGGHLGLIWVATESQTLPTTTGQTPKYINASDSGWTKVNLGGTDGSFSTSPNTYLYLFWRWVAGNAAALDTPSTGDSGNLNGYHRMTIAGADNTANPPFEAVTANNGTARTSPADGLITIPGGTTTGPNRLICGGILFKVDSGTASLSTTYTNANLAGPGATGGNPNPATALALGGNISGWYGGFASDADGGAVGDTTNDTTRTTQGEAWAAVQVAVKPNLADAPPVAPLSMYRADDLAHFGDGAAVDSWGNAMGLGAAGPGGTNPTLELNERNGHAVVRYDTGGAGGNEFSHTNYNGQSVSAAKCIFAVFKVTTRTGTDTEWLPYNGAIVAADGYGIYEHGTDSIAWYVNDNATSPIQIPKTISTGQWYRCHGRQSGTTYYFSLNGGAETSNAYGAYPYVAENYMLGGSWSSTAGQDLIGDVAEVLIYGSLTTQNITDIEAYLQQKYFAASKTQDDAAQGTDARSLAPGKTLSDTVAGTDQASRTATYTRTIADGIAATDQAARTTATVRPQGDSAALTDQVGFPATRGVQDQLRATDALILKRMMPGEGSQYERPNADVNNDGGWVANGGPSTLWDCLNETPASDTDYISLAPSADHKVCTIGLTDVTDPEVDTGHVVRYRYRKGA